VSDTTTSETDGAGAPTAVATPPAPPAKPPVTGTEMPDGDRRRNRRAGVWALVAVLVAVLMVGGLVWLVLSSIHGNGSADSAARQAAFTSAMKKAGVQATYPATAPVDLTTVVAKGHHAFSATFTPEEVAALLNTFSYTASVAGMEISLSRVTVGFPAPGTIQLDAQVSANGNAYSGSVTAPAVYASGQVYSTGATDLTVEGIGANSGQKSQVSSALVLYANKLLSEAPGLTVDTAAIQADGLHVSGSAPDSLSYP